MKYKLVYIIMIVVVLFSSLVFYAANEEVLFQRLYQHNIYPNVDEMTSEVNGINSHLPIIKIQTNGQTIPGTPIVSNEGLYELTPDGEKDIFADFQLFFSENESTQNFTAKINYRGNSSRYFSKKSFALRVVEKDGEEKSIEMLGMEKHDEWVLNGPYLDRSLLRNYLAMNLSGEIMPYAPEVRFVELIVNEKYEGLYLLMETISKGAGRIEVRTSLNNSVMTSYIVEMGRPVKMEEEFIINDFLTYTYRMDEKGLEVVYPGVGQYTPERLHYVEEDFSRIAKSLYERPLRNSYEGIAELIDVRSFQDYFIINELFRNVDAGYYSTYFYKDVRGLLTPAVWDFNNSLDNYQEVAHSVGGFTITNAAIFETLFKDTEFVDGLIDRYYYLRKQVLSEERLLAVIDDTILYLGPAIDRNNSRWSSVFDLTQYNELEYLERKSRNVESYEEAVTQMKSFLVNRGRWLDEHMETLRQYGHPSRNSFEIIR